MKNLNRIICLVFFSLWVSVSIQAEQKTSEIVTPKNVNKETNYKHLLEPTNGKKLTNKGTLNVIKAPTKIETPKVWHPRIKGLD